MGRLGTVRRSVVIYVGHPMGVNSKFSDDIMTFFKLLASRNIFSETVCISIL